METKCKLMILAVVSLLSLETANAITYQRRYRHRPRVVKVVNRPSVVVYKYDKSPYREHLVIAQNHLRKNKYLSIKKYARLTHLSYLEAERELDYFTKERRCSIQVIYKNKKKLYIRRL